MPEFIENDLMISKGATTIPYGQRTLNIAGKIHYWFIVLKAYWKIVVFYNKALREKECYYGPFKGEFGHFLLHNLPFLTGLYKKGVKIHYCGMQLHEAFLVDDKGKPIVYKYYKLRDFFKETPSSSNQTIPPADVQKEIDAFYDLAKKSGKPLLDIADNNLYWYVFRNWQLSKKIQSTFNIRQVYKTSDENAAVIFPRKKGNDITPNNGAPWDYMEIARTISPYFDKIYITGHPSMSAELESEGNIEVCLSPDNAVVLEKCSNASLVISQHSGALHIGIYTATNVLLIFKGDPPILGLIDTIRFRKHLTNVPLNYAFSMDGIEAFVKQRNYLSQ
jgi:hypothetical protein